MYTENFNGMIKILTKLGVKKSYWGNGVYRVQNDASQ